MQIDKIYFDMDGVLADFHRGTRELCGVETEGENAVEDEVMYAAMRKQEHFYLDLEPMPGTIDLFNELRDIYGENVEILSAIPRPGRGIPNSKDDKIEWIGKYLGKDVKVNIVFRKEKPDYAKGENTILIDDDAGNIAAWREAGGTGIQFTDAVSAKEILRTSGVLP